MSQNVLHRSEIALQELSRATGLHPNTIRNLDDKRKMGEHSSRRTVNNKRMFPISAVRFLCGYYERDLLVPATVERFLACQTRHDFEAAAIEAAERQVIEYVRTLPLEARPPVVK